MLLSLGVKVAPKAALLLKVKDKQHSLDKLLAVHVHLV